MKYAFLFSGQGAQYQGMIKELCEKSTAAMTVVEKISTLTGEDIPALLWQTDATILSRSDKSQLAITAVSLAICAALAEKNIRPSAVAGFSLGEFSALHCAGVLSFEDTIKLIQQRGIIMQKTCEHIAESSGGNPPGMTAVLKLPPEKIQELLAPYSDRKNGIAFAVNMNSPAQTVVAGTAEGLEKCEALCKEAGAKRCIRLPVAGPFHSPLMAQAAIEFEKVLSAVKFNDPVIPAFSNVTGKQIASGAEAKANLVKHITYPVLWTSEEAELAKLMTESKHSWSLLEVGPGTTLCGFWRDSGIEGYTCLPTAKLSEFEAIPAI